MAQTNAQMLATIAAGQSVTYRGQVLSQASQVPSDAQIALDYAADHPATPQLGSAGNLTADSPTGAALTTGPGNWTALHVPATATQATITKAAGAAGVRHVATGLIACVATGATAQTPLLIYIRDGATGAGAILLAAVVAAPANGVGKVELGGFEILGSPATAMTAEFAGAGVTASQETITLIGYDAS